MKNRKYLYRLTLTLPFFLGGICMAQKPTEQTPQKPDVKLIVSEYDIDEIICTGMDDDYRLYFVSREKRAPNLPIAKSGDTIELFLHKGKGEKPLAKVFGIDKPTSVYKIIIKQPQH